MATASVHNRAAFIPTYLTQSSIVITAIHKPSLYCSMQRFQIVGVHELLLP
jgi:hypothetical protein